MASVPISQTGVDSQNAASTRSPTFAIPKADHRKLWLWYSLGWLPLLVIYMIAGETDGNLANGINIVQALGFALRGIFPAVILLTLVWPLTGWMERNNFSAPRTLANHAAMAIIFAVTWKLSVYLIFYFNYGYEAAERARRSWFIWQFMWGLMIYSSIAGGFSAYRAIERAKAQAQAVADAQMLLVRSELSALRNKLNPHFLFNTLHSIIALVRKDNKKAESALIRFSDMLRYVLNTEKSGEDVVTLDEELDFTRNYLELEALRLGERLTVKWEVDESTKCVCVPALSVQPIVENSIKHAFNPRCEPGVLTIRAGFTDSTQSVLKIDIEDDGQGCEPQLAMSGSGLGLKTVARRLELAFGCKGHFDVDTSPGKGFRVTMHFPVE
jgi:signal transduction histidine kinase